MIAFIILLAYVANVFLNRWLSKIIYQKSGDEIYVYVWFLGLLGTLILTIWIIHMFGFYEWFSGKNWKRKKL